MKAVNETEPSESYCSLIIWPKVNGEYEFGVSFNLPEEPSDGEEFSFSSVFYRMNEKGELIENVSREEQEYLTLHSREINSLFEKAEKMWGIK